MSKAFLERPRAFCALGGALLTVTALPKVVPILHTAMGCGGSIYWNQYGSAGYLGAGYCGGLAVPSSNIQEKDIVFGGVERLHEQVENTLQVVDGDLYIVLTGCTADIIGDDIKAVVREFQADGKAIIGAETGGFRGDGYKGYDIVLSAIIKDYIVPKEEKVKNKVNLWGVVPGQDAFFRGNLLQLRRLLEKLGLKVNSFFTECDTLEDIKNAGDASLNIVVSEFFGIGAASEFELKHNVPYITNQFPIGPTATTDFIRNIGKALKLSSKKIESVIAEETKIYFRYVERIADAYNDLDFQRYAVVVGDANYSVAITKFLADDFGWLPELTVVTTEVDEPSKVTEFANKLTSKYPVSIVFETDPTEIKNHLWKKWERNTDKQFYDNFYPAFVIGGHYEREFAKDIGAAHLTITYPVGNRVVLNRGYAGFEGSLTLIEDLLSVIVSER